MWQRMNIREIYLGFFSPQFDFPLCQGKVDSQNVFGVLFCFNTEQKDTKKSTRFTVFNWKLQIFAEVLPSLIRMIYNQFLILDLTLLKNSVTQMALLGYIINKSIDCQQQISNKQIQEKGRNELCFFCFFPIGNTQLLTPAVIERVTVIRTIIKPYLYKCKSQRFFLLPFPFWCCNFIISIC